MSIVKTRTWNGVGVLFPLRTHQCLEARPWQKDPDPFAFTGGRQ